MKFFLFVLISFVAITAIISGLLIISDPEGGLMNLSQKMLIGTPFNSFLYPGLILATVVGGVNLLALVFSLQNHPRQYLLAVAGGIMTTGWIVAEMLLIRTFSWLQVLYFIVGVLTILSALQLNKNYIR